MIRISVERRAGSLYTTKGVGKGTVHDEGGGRRTTGVSRKSQVVFPGEGTRWDMVRLWSVDLGDVTDDDRSPGYRLRITNHGS